MPRRLLLAACALAFVPLIASCGDDDDADAASATASPTTSGQTGSTTGASNGASPTLSRPASQFSVSIDDIGIAWLTDIANTFVIDAATYGKQPMLFGNETEGNKLLTEWGYVEGYETAYIPEGRDTAVLKGSYYIKVETHLFKDAEGAGEAFKYFTQYASTSGASPVNIEPVGNSSVAFATSYGKIGGTNVNALYHQIVFRRGNVITIILTKGAQGFMKVDSAWDLAVIADEKLIGERPAVEPTPTSGYKTPTPAPKQ